MNGVFIDIIKYSYFLVEKGESECSFHETNIATMKIKLYQTYKN